MFCWFMFSATSICFVGLCGRFCMPKKNDFEYYLKKLEDVVDKLEKGGESIEESLKLYESGVENLKICLEKLKSAEQKVVEISPVLAIENSKKEAEPVF